MPFKNFFYKKGQKCCRDRLEVEMAFWNILRYFSPSSPSTTTPTTGSSSSSVSVDFTNTGTEIATIAFTDHDGNEIGPLVCLFSDILGISS